MLWRSSPAVRLLCPEPSAVAPLSLETYCSSVATVVFFNPSTVYSGKQITNTDQVGAKFQLWACQCDILTVTATCRGSKRSSVQIHREEPVGGDGQELHHHFTEQMFLQTAC